MSIKLNKKWEDYKLPIKKCWCGKEIKHIKNSWLDAWVDREYCAGFSNGEGDGHTHFPEE